MFEIYKQTVATAADQIRSGAWGWLHSQRNKQQRKKLPRCSKQRLNGTFFLTEKRNIWIFIAKGVVFTIPIILKSMLCCCIWDWRKSLDAEAGDEGVKARWEKTGRLASAVKPLSNLSAWYLDDTVETCRACRERGWTDSCI